MPYCKECGKKLLAGDKFCHYCGAPVSVKALRTSKEPRARPKAPQRTARTVGIIIVVIVIASVAIAALVATLTTERTTTPPPQYGQASIVYATAQGDANVVLGIYSETAVSDLMLQASNGSGEMITIDGTKWTSVSSGLWQGNYRYNYTATYDYGSNPKGAVIAVYILYKPIKGWRIFSSSTIGVQST